MSIVLFNVLGVQAVSTNRIAAELYISPGNLHYHFKTKFDILKAAYEQMEGEITVAIENIRFPLTASNSVDWLVNVIRSEEHTSELQSLMRNSYAVFCLKTQTNPTKRHRITSK